MSNKSLELAREARKPTILYECFDYKIEKIPYNYRATIKCALKRKHWWRKIDRELYSHPEHDLDYIKEIVEYEIKQWFKSGVATIPNENLNVK